MKQIQARLPKRPLVVVPVLVVLGLLLLVPLRATAQEEPAPPRPNNRPAEMQAGDPAPFPEGVGDRNMPPLGRNRAVRSSTGVRVMGPASERVLPGSPPGGPLPPTENAPARLEATVYEVQIPEHRIADLEAPALEAKAATVQGLAKALQSFGQPKLLYKIDQVVNLYGESIMIGTSEPMVTGARRADSGPAFNSVTYQQVGLVVNLAAYPPPRDQLGRDLVVQVKFELSALAESGVEIAPQAKAPSVRTMHLNHSETPRFGNPVVLLNVSALNGTDQAVAYVVRYRFTEGKP